MPSPWAAVRNSTQLDTPPDLGPWAPVESAPDMSAFAAPKQHVVEDPIAKQIDYYQNELQKTREAQARPWGFKGAAPSAEFPQGLAPNHNTKLGKLAHVFSEVGNIAGNIVAPNVMANIPGTKRNLQEKQAGLSHRLDQELAQESTEQEQGATTAHLNAETPEVAPNAASTRAEQAAQTANLQSETKMREHPLPSYQIDPGMLTQEGAPVKFETHTGAFSPGDVQGLHYGRAVDKFQQVSGTLNGAPAKAAWDPLNHIFLNPDTGEQIFGFKPQPQVGMMGPVVVSAEGDVTRATPGKHLPEGFRTISQGGSQNIPTTQMRNMGEMAETVVPMAQNVKTEVQQLAQALGPAVGRWNQLMVNKGGTDFPQFAGLDTDLDLLASAIVRTHFGARGGQQYREELRKMFGEAQTPQDLVSRIDHADSWLRGYAQAGGAKNLPSAAPTEPNRPANVPEGWHFDAHGPKGAGWYK